MKHRLGISALHRCFLMVEVRSFVYRFYLFPIILFILLFGDDYRLEIIFEFILFLIIDQLYYWRRRSGHKE